MPKLPHAGFTAEVTTGGRIAAPSPRPATAAETGGGIAAALGGLATAGTQLAGVVQRKKENEELRRTQIESLKTATAFEEELEAARQSGAEFDPIVEKHQQNMANFGETIETPGGLASLEESMLRLDVAMRKMVGRAQAGRVRAQANEDVATFTTLAGNQLLRNPDGLMQWRNEFAQLVSTFDLSPEERQAVLRDGNQTMGVAVADSLLQNDPSRLHNLLTKGPGIVGLEPPQTAQYTARAQAEMEAAARRAGSLDIMAKLALDDEMNARAELGRVSKAERPQWVEKGATAGAILAMEEKAEKIATAKEELARDMITVGAGSVAGWSQDRYQRAIDALTAEATAGDPPELKLENSMILRVEMAARNKFQDRVLSDFINSGAGARTEDGTNFQVGYTLRNMLAAKSPNLFNDMVDETSDMIYDLYDLNLAQGIPGEQARLAAQDSALDAKEVERRMQDKEVREIINDRVDDIAQVDDVTTGAFYVRRQLTDLAVKYQALNLRLTPDAAIRLAEQRFKQTHLQTNGFWVQKKGVPDDWDRADLWVRRIELKNVFERANLPIPNDSKLRNYLIMPKGDGFARVFDPDTGQTVIPNFNWRFAVARWREERGDAQDARKARIEQEAQAAAAQEAVEREELRQRTEAELEAAGEAGLELF